MRAMCLLAGCLAACGFSGHGDPLDDPSHDTTAADAAAPIETPRIVINEIAAGDNPDWFEIANPTGAPIELADYAFADTNDFAKAFRFPAMTLAPHAYVTQDVVESVVGFKLGGDESLWIFRVADHAIVDTVHWYEGTSPAGLSFARMPDTTGGEFWTGWQTPGRTNSYR